VRLSQARPRYAGQINQRRVTPGTFVEDKTVIATIADLRKLRLVGYIPEKAEPLVRQMLMQAKDDAPYEVTFSVRSFPTREFKGRVFYLSTVAAPDTHMFECKAEVEQTPDTALNPGFTAKLLCPVPGRESSLVIPEEALRATERGFIVFRPKLERDKAGQPLKDKEGKLSWIAEAVAVEPGMRRPGFVEI